MFGRKGLRQVGGEPLGTWKQVVRQLAKLRRKRKLATRAHRRMAREHLFDERRSGAWETHDEDWLRHVGANGRTRQQLELVSTEALPEARKKFFDGFSLVAQSAALGGELCFALDEIMPGLVISSNAIVQPPALESPIAIERGGGLNDRERLRVAPGARQELRPQQINVLWRPPRFGAVEQFRGTDEISPHFVKLRPVTERQEFAGRQPIRVGEQDIGFLEPALVHQVDGEICHYRRTRTPELQRTPEVALAGRKVAELGEERTEVLVRERIARIDAERLAGELFGLRAPAVMEQQRDDSAYAQSAFASALIAFASISTA